MVSLTFLSMVESALVDCADSSGQTDYKQTAINERRLPCGRKIFIIVIGARLLRLLKCERPPQSVRRRTIWNRSIAYGETIGYRRRMAIRIAKNDSVQANWLK
jgi:hypothetical protein